MELAGSVSGAVRTCAAASLRGGRQVPEALQSDAPGPQPATTRSAFEDARSPPPVPLLTGKATPEGTTRFRDRAVRDRRLPLEHFRPAPGKLWVSSLGLGTYIGPPDAVTDLAVQESATVCLTSGRVNVLDTAINYRYQRAERSLGRGLAQLVERGEVARDEVFVASKNGYLAPDAESKIPPERWVEEELVRPGILDPADIVDHCHAMSPSYLTDQFRRSLDNLGLASLDLLYLHNGPDAQIPVVGREAFLARLEAAFRVFEGFRTQDRLSFYGLATWDCLRARRTDAGYLSLESAVRVARKVGGADHGFRFLQFPFNLVMPEAATLRNQPAGGEVVDLFSAARKLGLGCFTSVPLFQGQLARTGPKRNGLTSAQTALQFARSAPGTLGPLIGQKRSEHLSENLEVAARLPWGAEPFAGLLA